MPTFSPPEAATPDCPPGEAYPFRPWLEYVWNAPFWMRAIHRPFQTGERLGHLNALCAFLNASRAKNGCITAWHVEHLDKTPDPWRLQLRQKYRLIATLADDKALLFHVRQVIAQANLDYQVQVFLLSSRIYYEELGLGALEYRLFMQLSTEDAVESSWQVNWDHFLRCREIWDSMDFTGLLETGMLQIQLEWTFVRGSIRAGIEACFPQKRFLHMEEFLGWRDPGSSSRMYQPDGNQDEKARDDDFLWTYCMDIVLYRDASYEINEQAVSGLVSTLHEIGLGMDCIADRNVKRPAIDEAETDYHRTSAYLLRMTDGKSVDALYAGFGMVALVTEEGPYLIGNVFGDYEASSWESPSARVLALRRRMLMNYGLLTVAADGLRAYLASILLLPDDRAIYSQHERLRLVVSALAMLKYDAMREVIESDDLETYVYGDLYTTWGLAQQNQVLTGLMADADTATTRISEATSHKEERNLGFLILLLTVATMGGVLSEVYTFILESEEPKVVNLAPQTLHWLLLGVVWVIPLTYAYVSGMFEFGLLRQTVVRIMALLSKG